MSIVVSIGKVKDYSAKIISFSFNLKLSLGAVIAIFSGIIFNGEKIVGSKNLLPSLSSTLSLYHLVHNVFNLPWTFPYGPKDSLAFEWVPKHLPVNTFCEELKIMDW
jgi:hypothetical protein